MDDINRSNGPRPGSTTSVDFIDKDSLDKVLNSIENLVNNTSYINEALNCIRDIDEDEEWKEHKTSAMLEVVKAREETNREALNVLKNLVEHLTNLDN